MHNVPKSTPHTHGKHVWDLEILPINTSIASAIVRNSRIASETENSTSKSSEICILVIS